MSREYICQGVCVCVCVCVCSGECLYLCVFVSGSSPFLHGNICYSHRVFSVSSQWFHMNPISLSLLAAYLNTNLKPHLPLTEPNPKPALEQLCLEAPSPSLWCSQGGRCSPVGAAAGPMWKQEISVACVLQAPREAAQGLGVRRALVLLLLSVSLSLSPSLPLAVSPSPCLSLSFSLSVSFSAERLAQTNPTRVRILIKRGPACL